MSKADDIYARLLNHVLMTGKPRNDRTGTGTVSVFGAQVRFDLREEFPLITTKAVKFSNVVAELLWFLSGSTNVKDLQAMGCHIWDPWAADNGELGPIYGYMWRVFQQDYEGGYGYYGLDSVDQISEVIKGIKNNRHSRRHLVSAWHPSLLPDETRLPQENAAMGQQCLAPCHCLFQFYVQGSKLSCQLYQRSADLFIGVPYNIASYALLTHLIADQCNLHVGEFIHTFGDLHLYNNHLELARMQMLRQGKEGPELFLKRLPDSIFNYKMEDIELLNYNPHPAIKAKVSV
jgi:thymidylate synthase